MAAWASRVALLQVAVAQAVAAVEHTQTTTNKVQLVQQLLVKAMLALLVLLPQSAAGAAVAQEPPQLTKTVALVQIGNHLVLFTQAAAAVVLIAVAQDILRVLAVTVVVAMAVDIPATPLR